MGAAVDDLHAAMRALPQEIFADMIGFDHKSCLHK